MTTCDLCRDPSVEYSGVGAKIEHVATECTASVVYRMRWLLDEAYMQSAPVDKHIRSSIRGALKLLEKMHRWPIR